MTEISLNYDVLQKCMGSEQYFTEATEHAASFNTRMKLERKMRLPFLDSQTGVAQNHTDIWHTYRHRQPGKFHGQIYSYPEKRWKKKKHFFQFPEIKSLKATDIETGESGDSRGIREPLITFSKCQVPFLQSHGQMRTNPIDKHAAYLEPRYMFAEPSTVRRKLRSFNTDMQLHPDMHQISTVENPAAAGSGVGRAEPEEFPSETSKEKWYDEYDEYLEPPDAGEVIDEVSDMSDYEETFKKKKKKAKGGGRPRGRKKATKERDLEAERLEEEKEKPYACEVCSARYKTRPGLSYHYAHFHGGMMEPEEAEASPKAVDEVEPVKRKVPVRRQPPRGSSGPTSTLDPGSHIPTGERGEDGKVQSSDYCDFCLGDSVENKKSGIPEELVSCSDCGRSGHPTCLQFTDNMTVSVKKYPWQCIECKSCGLCGTSENDEQLLFCDDCDRGYHMYCLNPPLAEAPEGNWSCHLCIEEFHGGKKPEGMQ